MTKIIVRIPGELRDLAPAYLERRKQDLPGLKDALTRKDFEFISRLCHKTKGTAGGYGFTELGVLARSLETAAKSEDPGAAESALEAIERYLSNVEIGN
jgi:HPt (histidine-containing phosphotransfer) domain-containing protein